MLPQMCVGILFTQQYKGCQMTGLIPCVPVGQNLSHPACQCGTRPQFIPGSRYCYRGGGDIAHGSKVRFKRLAPPPTPVAATAEAAAEAATAFAQRLERQISRQVKTPWWVSRTLYPTSILQTSAKVRDPGIEHPRWQKFTNIGRGICGRKCRVPVAVRDTYFRIDVGLIDAISFWSDFESQTIARGLRVYTQF